MNRIPKTADQIKAQRIRIMDKAKARAERHIEEYGYLDAADGYVILYMTPTEKSRHHFAHTKLMECGHLIKAAARQRILDRRKKMKEERRKLLTARNEVLKS